MARSTGDRINGYLRLIRGSGAEGRDQVLTRISHELTTAAAYTSALTALCSFGLLDVLYKYDCGVFISGRMPCQDSVCTASLR